MLLGHADMGAEVEAAVKQIRAWLDRGIQGQGIGAFARTETLTTPLCAALTAQGMRWRRLNDPGPAARQVGSSSRGWCFSPAHRWAVGTQR